MISIPNSPQADDMSSDIRGPASLSGLAGYNMRVRHGDIKVNFALTPL